jgi:tRNA(fMet)-specific endonuclease VapC
VSLFILDTDIVTLASHRHPQVTARIQRASQSDRVTVSVITVREIMEGRLASIKRSKQPAHILSAYESLKQSTELLSTLPILAFGAAAFARFRQLLQMKLNVRNDDLRIAAIAVEESGVVVTRNLRDFRRVPGLACEDWSV